MKIEKLIQELQKFDSNMEVIITDGYNCKCYSTDKIIIQEFEDSVDISIGGCEIEE